MRFLRLVRLLFSLFNWKISRKKNPVKVSNKWQVKTNRGEWLKQHITHGRSSTSPHQRLFLHWGNGLRGILTVTSCPVRSIPRCLAQCLLWEGLRVLTVSDFTWLQARCQGPPQLNSLTSKDLRICWVALSSHSRSLTRGGQEAWLRATASFAEMMIQKKRKKKSVLHPL